MKDYNELNRGMHDNLWWFLLDTACLIGVVAWLILVMS